MKKILLLTLVAMLMFMSLPTMVVLGATTLNPSGPTTIAAPMNDGDYDNSTGKSGIPVEGGNLSFNEGDYVIFNVSVSKKGDYLVDFLTGAPGAGPVFDIYVNGQKADTVALSAGTGYVNYHLNDDLGKITLESGNNEVKIVNADVYGVYFREIIFEPATKAEPTMTEGPYKAMYLPTIIEAENFDLGSKGSVSIDGRNNGRAYRRDDQIDIYSNNIGGYYVTLNNTESTTYTFKVTHDGNYTLYLGINSTGNAEIYFDNAPYPVNVASMSNVQEMNLGCYYLEEGTHAIKIKATAGNFTFDKVRFAEGGENPIYIEDLWKEKTPDADESEEEDKAEESVHSIYKNLYISENGSDSGDGSEEKPFLTFERVKEEIVNISDGMTGDIVINILPGSYHISETLQLTNEHGGKNGYNIIFRGTDKQNPPIIHGGTKLTDWEKTENGIYKASLDTEYLRNLYVDGQPMIRARSKYMYPVKAMYDTDAMRNEGIIVDGANFPEFSKPYDLETVWPLTWFVQRLLVDDIEPSGNDYILHMQQPKFAMKLGTDTIETVYGKGFYLENAIELLDEPGEFYFDREEKTVYFYPYKEQNINTAEIYAPTTEYLVNVNGNSKDDKVENITFENLDFRYGAWNDTSKEGYKGTQATSVYKMENEQRIPYTMPAQFMVNRAKNIDVKDCRFSCMTANALAMEDAVSDSEISGSAFWNLGAMGVIIDTPMHDVSTNKDIESIANMEQCKNITIKNNLFRRVAIEYAGCVAIHSYFAKNLKIYHNDIAETPYTGMSVGWGWGAEQLTDCSFDISYNRVVDVNKYLADGGSLYTLGETTGSIISYNYFKKNGDSRGGVYHDSGSANIETFKNVFEDVSRWWIQGMYHTENLKAYDNFSERVDIWEVAGTTNTKQSEIMANGHTLVPDGNWTGEAAEIIENSGLEKEYYHLFDLVKFPEWLIDPIDSYPKTDFNTSRLNVIQAEDYMLGGEGIGYHKITPVYGASYRPMEGVDLYKDYTSTAMGYVISTDFHGEWWAYVASVSEDGEYAIDLRAGQSGWGSGADVYVDGEKVAEGVLLTDDDSYQIMNLTRVATVNLTKGNHIVKIVINGGSFFFDALAVTKSDIPVIAEAGTCDEGKILSYDEYEAKKAKLMKEEISFADMENHWAKKDVSILANGGIIAGVGDNLFAPDSLLTKKQASLLLLRTLKIVYNEETENDWERFAIEAGLLTHGENVDEEISRERFAQMLISALLYKGVSSGVDAKNKFADHDEISDECKMSAMVVRGSGLMLGDENGMFNPKKTLSRAEAARTIKRFIYLK